MSDASALAPEMNRAVASRFEEVARLHDEQGAGPFRVACGAPPVAELLDVDREYREGGSATSRTTSSVRSVATLPRELICRSFALSAMEEVL